jgi:hypothetical protein
VVVAEFGLLEVEVEGMFRDAVELEQPGHMILTLPYGWINWSGAAIPMGRAPGSAGVAVEV